MAEHPVKRKRRFLVKCPMPTMGGETKTFSSKPVSAAQAKALENHLRSVGLTPARYSRSYTDEELERAEKLAEAGQDIDDIGEED